MIVNKVDQRLHKLVIGFVDIDPYGNMTMMGLIKVGIYDVYNIPRNDVKMVI
jgi:hypothetical protein